MNGQGEQSMLQQWVRETASQTTHLDSALLENVLNTYYKLQPEPSEQLENISINMAEQLLSLNCDNQSIAVALLYPLFKTGESTRTLIQKQLGPQIYKLLLGTKRLEMIDQITVSKDTVIIEEKQLDNLRRMILAIVDDARIVIIKLAERIVTLMELRKAPNKQQEQIGRQTLALYAPLANRLGVGQFKWQLEDWSLRYIDPDSYFKISKGLKQRRTDREDYINMVRDDIQSLVTQTDIEDYELSGRAKHIYSIHKKITRKQVTLQEIYDSNAFRVLVKSIKDCYTLLSAVHEKWPHIDEEFDDYIAKPKPNGYRSIHTVIIGPEDRNVEIQIRTFAMHEEAELGVAAHWKYKESGQQSDNYEDKITLLRDMIGWQQSLHESKDDQHKLYQKLFEDRVYVFTPNNDILDLPVKATPLDMAYHIHTELGHRCKGAKVNGKLVPLTHQIKTGDVIDIQVGKVSSPSRDWINPERGYLVTRTALTKVKSWFHRQFQKEKLQKGTDLWDKAAKKEGLNSKQALSEGIKYFNFKTAEDLLINIGSGHIGPNAVIRRLKPQPKKAEVKLDTPKPHTNKAPLTSIKGTENLLSQIARCCQPIPGDNITGYITKGHGISIHRSDCKNLQQSKINRPERIIDVSWGKSETNTFPITIHIEAINRANLIKEITSVISNENLSLTSINSHINQSKNLCYVCLTLDIGDLEVLSKLLVHLQQIPDVSTATRG